MNIQRINKQKVNRDKLESSHITLQPKSGYLLKLSRAEPDQYLDGRPPGKTRLLLEEVLVRPAGGAHPAVYVGPNTQCSDRDTILSKITVLQMRH